MKQWQIVQHKIDDKFRHSLSFVDVENNVMTFMVSIDIEPNDAGKLVAIRHTLEGKQFCEIDPASLLDFIVEITNENKSLVAYRREVVND